MKIKLQITPPDGAARSLTLDGPDVAIGRNPDSPVSFAGDAGKGVSWDHAAIRAEGRSITVADLGSSNGTLLNDKMLEPNRPVALKAKDRIQLGHTGPKIVLVGFDPGPAAPARKAPVAAAPPPAAPRRQVWPFVAGGAAVVLLAVVGIAVFGGKKKDGESTPIAQGEQPKNDPKPIPQKANPAPEIRPFAGRVLKPENDYPGTLLQWPGDPAAWVALAGGNMVQYGQLLLALPGFRCQVQLLTGARVSALSNLPVFNTSPFDPLVVETAWVHAPPEPGFDANLVFDRGRLLLSNGKPTGPARFKLALRNSEWEVVLKDGASRAVVECWFPPMFASKIGEPLEAKTETMVGFFTEGDVELRRSDKSFTVNGTNWLRMAGREVDPNGPQKIERWPAWWQPNLAKSDDFAVLYFEAIKNWSEALAKSDDVLKTVLDRCAQADKPLLKEIAYLYLGSFGEVGATGVKAIEFLCQILESTSESEETRLAALNALRTWLSRSAKHLPTLIHTATMVRTKRYSPTDAETILRLVIAPAPEDAQSPELYQGWIAALGSPQPVIRFLAWEQLQSVLDPGVKSPKGYDVNADPKGPEQVRALAEWKKMVPPNWVPKR